jgi:hypothetical protein
MPPTRVQRTDTIANISDFGAVPDDPGSATLNAKAIAAAFESGRLRVVVPAGDWYYAELSIFSNNWLPDNAELFGEGRERSFLHYAPDDIATAAPAIQFSPKASSRTMLHDLTILGPPPKDPKEDPPPPYGSPDVSPLNTGLKLFRSGFGMVYNVSIWHFAVGIDLDPAPDAMTPTAFTGVTAIEHFEITGCPTGIKMRDATNGVYIASGRILYAVKLTGDPVTAEEGIGIDIQGTYGPVGPGGGNAVVISQVTIEPAVICIRIENSHDISVIGCYFEPGKTEFESEGLPQRRMVEIDEASERLVFLGNVMSNPDINGVPEQDWTPVNVLQVPESRGVIDLHAFADSGDAHKVNGFGAGIHGATAAHANHIRNGDMSRGTMYWNLVGIGAVSMSAGVVGKSSLMLVSSSTVTHHMAQDFMVDHGVRSITANVRYRFSEPIVADKSAFRIELVLLEGDPETETVIGFYTDTDPDPSAWRLRSLTARFDGSAGGVVGPRKFRIKLYPYHVNVGPGVANQFILMDSVWVVDGEYAAPYRPYIEGLEVLPDDKRLNLFLGLNTHTNLSPSSIAAGTPIPANAVGMITEVSIEGSDATATDTFVRIVDDSGTGGPGETRTIHAYVDGRPTVVEYTVPLNGTPTWETVGAGGSNAISYHIRVKAWIYRL